MLFGMYLQMLLLPENEEEIEGFQGLQISEDGRRRTREPDFKGIIIWQTISKGILLLHDAYDKIRY